LGDQQFAVAGNLLRPHPRPVELLRKDANAETSYNE
jgi:hypothetical protein